MKAKRFFTLAEVLMTLTIIGVVSSMSITPLLNNTNRQEYAATLKKTYSSLSNANMKILQEKNCIGSMSCAGLSDAATRENNYAQALANVLPDPQLALHSSLGKGCFADVMVKEIDGTYWADWGGNLKSSYAQAKVKFGDGSCVMITASGACDTDPASSCYKIIVDTNGAKNPNQWGRDTFQFIVYSDGSVKPEGYALTKTVIDADCNISSSSGFGAYCTTKVLRESAMNY